MPRETVALGTEFPAHAPISVFRLEMDLVARASLVVEHQGNNRRSRRTPTVPKDIGIGVGAEDLQH